MRPLLANRLRHQVYLQTATMGADDGGGGAAETWADSSGPVWAEVEPLTGDEALRAMQNEARVTHRITIRYRTGVTPARRIRWGSRVFDIQQAVNVGERGEMVEMLAEEVVT